MEKIASVLGLLDVELFICKSGTGYLVGIECNNVLLSTTEIKHDDFIKLIKEICRREELEIIC